MQSPRTPPPARPWLVALGAAWLLSSAPACSSDGPDTLSAPVAALRHAEVVRVGQPLTLSASASAFDAATSFDAVRFRFRVADGRAEVETDTAVYDVTLHVPGEFGVGVEVVGSDGQTSLATSSVTVVADYTAVCPDGDAALAGCASGECAGDVCAVLACAGADACPEGAGLSCDAGVCRVAPTRGGDYDPGPDAGSRAFDGG